MPARACGRIRVRNLSRVPEHTQRSPLGFHLCVLSFPRSATANRTAAAPKLSVAIKCGCKNCKCGRKTLGVENKSIKLRKESSKCSLGNIRVQKEAQPSSVEKNL